MSELFANLYATYLVLGVVGFTGLLVWANSNPYKDSSIKTGFFLTSFILATGSVAAAIITLIAAIWVF